MRSMVKITFICRFMLLFGYYEYFIDFFDLSKYNNQSSMTDHLSSKQETLAQTQREMTKNKTLYEKYTNFIDSSKCVLDFYQNKKVYPGQEKNINKINSWLEEENTPNKPLVFRTQPGCGIKTILSNWEKSLHTTKKAKKQKVLTIMHFASSGSNNANYFYSLYRIIIKLRESLKLKQNVDLLEENIRKFFAYWLDLCSSEVERQLVIYCAQDIYDKIVIVIEAVDKFVDGQTGKEANIAFWLPENFPKNIKVIVTANKRSESMKHLEKLKCDIIDIRTDPGIVDLFYINIRQTTTALKPEVQSKYFEILDGMMNKMNNMDKKRYINVYTFFYFYQGVFFTFKSQNKESYQQWKEIVETKVDFEKLAQIQSIDDLYNIVIQMACENSAIKNKIQSALVYLSLTQKGLTVREIMMLTKMSEKQWSYFLTVFEPIMIRYKDIYSLKSTSFIKNLFNRLKITNGHSELLQQYHEKIAKALETTENSIRKLEEQTYHLFTARSYFKLKEMISNIENFLLMYNPNNKYELSRYWQKLQEKGFDPVIQYNKAVEGFSMHYHPSDQNTFRIIVQISRFLKEFCDFETYDTPSFRHPLIEGNMLELKKIGLLKELSGLQIFIDNSFNNHDEVDVQKEQTLEEQTQELKERYFPKENTQAVACQGQKKTDININEVLENICFDLDKNKMKIKKKSDGITILSDIQQLNVDVPMNRNKFRQFYLQTYKDFMKNEQNCLNSFKKDNNFLDVEEPYNNALNTNTNAMVGLTFSKIRESYRNKQITPSLYYYKRWIWIQFPWVCISLNNNYSTTPQLRKKIQGDDIDSLEQEYKYTKQSLMVAIEAREKKRQMFTKKEESMDSSKGFYKVKNNMFTISKATSMRGKQSKINEAMKTKKNNSSIFDMSLQNLTKDLELQKAKLGIKDEDLNESSNNQFYLTEVGENINQDLKFINLRKTFKNPKLQNIEPNQVLPKLKWVIKEHTNYEVEYIKNHIQEKKKKLNKIIYDNKKLSDIFRQLKIKENLSQKNKNDLELEKGNRKNKALEDLYIKKENVITQFCKSLLQKERLKIILKLCSQNKTKNEQYLTSLNYLLQNVKKMINNEKDNMKNVAQELEEHKNLNQRQAILEVERDRNERIVQRQVENYIQEKNHFEEQIQGFTHTIEEDLKNQKSRFLNSLNGEIRNKEEKNQIKEQEKNLRQLQDKYHRISKDYNQLKQIFQFEEKTNILQSKQFSKLLQSNEKNKELKILFFTRKNKLEELERELQKVKEDHHKEVQNQIKRMTNQHKTDKKEPKKNADQKLLNRKYEIMIDNVKLKLGIKQQKDIISTLRNRMEKIKEHGSRIVA